MSVALLEKIDQLDDAKAIRILELFSTRLFEGMETSPQQMLEAIPDEYNDRVPFESILAMSNKERAQRMPEAESIALTRELLYGFAQDPAFAPALEDTLAQYTDNKLMVGEILAVGVAVSMIIVTATTAFKGKIGGVEVEKKTADAALVEKVLKYFPKLG